MTAHAASWFHNAVIEGVQLLVTFALPGMPAAEVLPLTTLGWVETLWRGPVAWSEADDTARLHEAFLTLARRADRWPAPRHLLDVLPPRLERPLLPAPTPRPTPAQRAALAAARRRLHDRVGSVWQSTSLRGEPDDEDGRTNGTLAAQPPQQAEAAAGGEQGANREE